MIKEFVVIITLSQLVIGCSDIVKDNFPERYTVQGQYFETLSDGREIKKWDLRRSDGSGPVIMDLGAAILSVHIPDHKGQLADVVLGFDKAVSYTDKNPYFGVVLGRYANRIANGKFTLDGKEYQLPINNGANSLHGGVDGFDKRFWQGKAIDHEEGKGVQFTLVSPDGDQGYPGELTASVSYIWTKDYRLIIDYAATTTAPTPVNLSQHSYWNLGGAAKAQSILDHRLRINADQYTPMNASQIPTGTIKSVKNTPLDFRKGKLIGQDIDADFNQIEIAKGYDHNFVLNGDGMKQAARLWDPVSARRMTVFTDQPAMQLYTANFLKGAVVGKEGNAYPRRSAVAFETQHFPDSPNQPHFPNTILRPGKEFKSRTIFAFDAIKPSVQIEDVVHSKTSTGT